MPTILPHNKHLTKEREEANVEIWGLQVQKMGMVRETRRSSWTWR